MQTGRASLGSGGIDEELRGLAGMLNVAGNHGNYGVRKSLIVAIVLHYQGRSVLPASSFDVGNFDDYNITAASLVAAEKGIFGVVRSHHPVDYRIEFAGIEIIKKPGAHPLKLFSGDEVVDTICRRIHDLYRRAGFSGFT